MKKVILMILDGWGIAPNKDYSAVEKAQTPFIDSLSQKYPTATLRTDGTHVGLPEGQMGNSEVGHLNLGAGRVVYQNLVKINKAVKEKTLGKEKVLLEALQYAKENNKNIHLLGLVSDGGIHSHINHLKGLIEVANEHHCKNVFLHAFTDGRDCDPKSGIDHIKEIESFMKEKTGTLASVIGRYYAMDRDKRWERIKLAYDALMHGSGATSMDIEKSMLENYEAGITDEFIKPILLTTPEGKPKATIQKDDVILFFNYRTDRGRELTQVLSQEAFKEFQMSPIPLHYVTMTKYDKNFKGVRVIYDNSNLEDTLGEVLEKAQRTQLRIAETEKYPHVTFFFSGGREEPFQGESRILCPSPKVATYDLQPEMSAHEITEKVLPVLEENKTDFICLNYANGDMVGHTGDMEAAIKACETVDKCVEQVIHKALENNYTALVIADHGNCEIMKNKDGSPNTAHTINPVPFILVDTEIKKIKEGILSDIAPTILDLMGISKPDLMDRESLVDS